MGHINAGKTPNYITSKRPQKPTTSLRPNVDPNAHPKPHPNAHLNIHPKPKQSKFRNQKLSRPLIQPKIVSQTTTIDPYDAYKNTYYVKPWVKDYGYLPIIESQLILTKMNETGKQIPYKEGDPIPEGMKKMRIVTTKLNNGKLERNLIDVDEYQGVTFSPDQFEGDLEGLKKEKWRRNDEFIYLLRKHDRPNRKIVYLDSPALLTTRYLDATGLFSKDDLFVPNIDLDFSQKINSSHRDLFTLFQCSIYEWMRDLPPHLCKFCFDVGMDYCCTFHGNDKVKPKADLALMFQNGILAKHNGVLWLTFSYRQKNNGVEKTTREVSEWIQMVAKENDYQIKLVSSGSYRGVVYFYFVTNSL
jgi:hypothetical protein